MEMKGEKGTQTSNSTTISSENGARILQLEVEKTELRAKLDAEKTENDRLRMIIRNFNKALYGSSSEKSKYILGDDEIQPELFNEAEMAQDDHAPEPTPETFVTTVKEHNRKKKRTRAEMCKDLPIEEVVYDVPIENRTDKSGRPYKFVTKKYVRSEMIITPKQFRRINYYTNVYVSQEIEEATGKKLFVEAKVTPPVMKNSLASPSSVADVMTRKYVEGMPLYRQEQEWNRLGVNIPRNTLANWVIKPTESWFMPVYAALKDSLLQEKVIHADETTVQVLKEPGKKPDSTSYMWVYASSERSKRPVRIFEYQDSRSGQCAKAFLEGFHGVLISDGYNGYNGLAEVTRAGCWAHVRRKWMEAMPPNAKVETSKAAQGFAYCNQLFEIEREFKHLPDDKRREERLKRSKPKLDEIWKWLGSFIPEKGSKLAGAVQYTLNMKPYLCVFLDHGEIEISNNQVENAIRPFVVGRKGWLFSDTPKGATASATVYTLVETAKANGLDPYRYLLRLLTELPMYEGSPTPEQIESFMPWNTEIQAACSIQK